MNELVEIYQAALPQLLNGFIVTLQLTFISLIGGFFLGVVLAIGRVYGNRIISGICTIYIECER